MYEKYMESRRTSAPISSKTELYIPRIMNDTHNFSNVCDEINRQPSPSVDDNNQLIVENPCEGALRI